MKPVLQAVLFLGLVTPSFSAALVVDFDGKHKGTSSLVFDVQDFPIAIPATNPVASLKVRALLKDGTWLPIEPQKTADGKDSYEFEPSSIINYTYTCKGSSSGTWSIKLNITDQPKYGGHQHNNPAPPKWTFRNHGAQNYTPMPNPYSSPTLPVNTDLVLSVVMPAYATKSSDKADFSGACTGSLQDEENVKIPNLVEMTAGTDYSLVGSTPSHPSNHYATADTIASLTSLAKEWREKCSKGRLLQYNDMSLIWGGLFDVNANWKTPHVEHRKGLNLDLSKRNINKKDRKTFLELACGKADVLSEGDAAGEAPHYHLSFTPPAPDKFYEYPYEFAEDATERKLKCCPVADLSEADLKKCTELGDAFTETPNVPTCE